MFRRIIFILYILLFFICSAIGQFYETGQDPSTIKWEQIKTPHFKVVFPKSFYDEANRYANILENSQSYSAQGLNVQPRKIPVLLHNQSILSNGFVSWAPKRMELVTAPPQETYPHDWFEQLALHEYRHVVQVSKLNQGITKFFSFPFGQMATGASVGFLPLWFLEGDAVLNETQLSNSGRGRVPAFEMELRAINLEKSERYSYDKAYLGSYKDHIPNHYQLGYQMVAYSNLKYGDHFWENILDNVAKKPYTFAPFYFGLKKEKNLSKVTLYNEAFDSLTYMWNNSLDTINVTKTINRKKPNTESFTSYRYPKYYKKHSIILEKSGIDQLTEFVVIDSLGKESKLFTPGYINYDNISLGGDLLTWTEYIPDSRWGQQNFSVIKLLNLKTLKEKQLTYRSRYFSPAINKNGNKLVCIETDTLNKYSLVFLDINTGKPIFKTNSPDNVYISQPYWHNDDLIVMLSLNHDGESIISYHPSSGEWNIILSPSFTDISQPINWNDYILYRASYSGIENLYALHIPTKKRYQITSSVFGAFDPATNQNGQMLAYSDYTLNGYRLSEIYLDTTSWIPFENVKSLTPGWAEKLSEKQNFNIQKDTLTIKKYKSHTYSRIGNLFNFHSWAPFYADYENFKFSDQSISPGFLLFSQNLLGTAISTLGYSYRNGEHYIHPRFIYKGFYPVIEVSADIGGTPDIYKPLDLELLPQKIATSRKYFITTYIPLNFTFNKYNNYIEPQLDIEFNNSIYYDKGFQQNLVFVHLSLYYHRYLKLSYRDIIPKWGQFFYFTYTTSPTEDKYLGSLFSGYSLFTFPGFFKHHGFQLTGGMQIQHPKYFLYGISRIAFPKGYDNYTTEKIYKTTAEYTFPVFYPDLSIGPLAYIKRIRSTLFADYVFGKHIYGKPGIPRGSSASFYSYGLELLSDTHFMRFIFPVSIGMRFSFLPKENNFVPELLFSINTSVL
ncbi:MAG: hypothetical protein JXJ22_05470 [Bacteroidales bacterium]|nr:hypothetical protein [Bacteroidales bacterium]